MDNYQWRIKAAALLTMLFFGIVIIRIWYISRSDSLSIPGWKKYHIPKYRGAILDRNGAYLALTADAVSVFVRPAKFKGTPDDLVRLSKLLEIPAGELQRRIKQGSSGFTWLKRQISVKTGKAVKALGLPGIGLTDEPRRIYPNGPLAAGVLGFTGVDHIGLTGTEKFYDKTMLPAAAGNGRINNLVLTLDRYVQYIVEDELNTALTQHRAKAAIGLVYDPHSGEFLAMGNVPGFDPNRFTRYRPARYLNQSISIPYEPGSTFKIFTAAYLLAHQAISYKDKIYCPGKIQIYNHTVHCTRPHGYLNLPGVIQESCNTGTILFSRRINSRKFFNFLGAMGFGRPTGIGLPGERSGILHPPEHWSGLSKSMISIGHEVSVTPLQLIRAAAAVVSEGRIMKPHIVKAVVDWNGRLVSAARPEIAGRPFSPAVARDLYRMLLRVVSKGTGTLARIPGIFPAGKTGTANIPKPDGSGYYQHRYNSSFLGYLPVAGTHLVILVILREPKGAYYGGTIAAPVFQKIGTRILQYLKKKAE